MDIDQPYDLMSSSNSSISSFMSPGCNNFQENKRAKEVAEEVAESSLKQAQKESIEEFWNQQLYEIQNVTMWKAQHQLPLARIKRVMKSEGDVKMISSDTPILFSKACELFIMEITLRSWMQTEDGKRRTLQRCDIARAVWSHRLLDFLHGCVPFGQDCYDVFSFTENG